MKYELIIETKICISFSHHAHNRDGLMNALERICCARENQNFCNAEIYSQRDGLIFTWPNKNKILN